MKKIIGFVLFVALLSALLISCTASKDQEATAAPASGETTDAEAAPVSEPKEVEKIKVYLPTSGTFQDLDEVVAAVNEISREKIGVEVEFHPYEFGQWLQQYSLFLSGTEEIDLLANYGGFIRAVTQGAAYDLTELLPTHGQDIIKMEGEFLRSGEVNGVQYAVPIYASYAWTMGILYRADVVRELGLEEKVAAVKTPEDWGEILAAVKEGKPEMTPFVANNTSSSVFQFGTWDSLTNNYGVLMNGGETADVVNLFETEEYAKLVNLTHDWNVKGYSSKDIATATDPFAVLTQNDAAFSTFGQADFNTSFYQSTTTNKEIGVIQFGDSIARTYDTVSYIVMSNSKHAEAAVKFMNLWFSDREVGNLIAYGIEGKHYLLNDQGMGTYPEGENARTSPYHLGAGINNTNRIRWEGENPDYAERLIESNDGAKKSVALGFSFNTDNISNELTQLDNVRSKYQIGLESGLLDPETELPKFISELKDAGIDKVIEEKQNQLNAWLEAHGK